MDNESSLMIFWCLLKLPVSVSVVLKLYQKKEHELLAGLKGIEPIADDILIVGCLGGHL